MSEKKQKRRGHGEGSIYQRKDGRWGATISLENGKRKTLYGKTRKEVADKLNTALQEQKQGLLVTGPSQTVANYLHYWLEKVHKTTIRASTYALYRRHLKNHIVPALGHIQLQKLTADQVQAFCSEMASEGLSSGTIRLLHTILSTALGDAVRWKRLATNVCDAVKLPRLSQREVRPLDQEQAQRLLQAAQGNRLACLLTVALTTGMRLGELLALRWDDVNLEKQVLQVRSTVDYIPGRGHDPLEHGGPGQRRAGNIRPRELRDDDEHLRARPAFHAAGRHGRVGRLFPGDKAGEMTRFAVNFTVIAGDEPRRTCWGGDAVWRKL